MQIYGDSDTADLAASAKSITRGRGGARQTIRMTGITMGFLLRMAFWLGLVFVLLPTDKTPDAATQPQIGAMEAVTAATAAVADMAQFCNRQPEACAVGGQAASMVGARAQAGAKKVYHFITDQADKTEAPAAEPTQATPRGQKDGGDKAGGRKNPEHTGSIIDIATPAMRSGDTLSAQDLQIEWQAPVL